MKSQKNSIFAVLKVVRDGDLKQAIPRTHNNLKPYRVQASRPVCLLLRFFYCAVVFLVQPAGTRSQHSKTSVSNPLFRGRKSASSNFRLLTGDLHVRNTAEKTKIVGWLRGYCNRVVELKNTDFVKLISVLLKTKTLHAGMKCLCLP